MTEQPLNITLSTLFSKNLFASAISLATSQRVSKKEIAEIYKRYGDYLYGKGDYEGAMNCYLRTVGTVQASYVIRKVSFAELIIDVPMFSLGLIIISYAEKFLDAQRLSYLTLYLQDLHTKCLANSDHTTLLLNCYTNMSDDTALSSFLQSSCSTSANPISGRIERNKLHSLDEPPFDLETAIRVCRQSGHFQHAVWLADRYGDHQEYLRIQIEDRADYLDALSYLRTLSVKVAEDNLVRYGKTLLAADPNKTTDLLVDLCCGTFEGLPIAGNISSSMSVAKTKTPTSHVAQATPAQSNSALAEGATNLPFSSTHATAQEPLPDTIHITREATNSRETKNKYIPSPRQFFAQFVDHPAEFISFLETVAARRYDKEIDKLAVLAGNDRSTFPNHSQREVSFDNTDYKDEQAIWNTLLELYLSQAAAVRKDSENSKSLVTSSALYAKALVLLQMRDRIPYDETQALIVCTNQGFVDGFILLYEQLGMHEEIIRYWIDASLASPSSSIKCVEALYLYGPSTPRLYRLVLQHLTSSGELMQRHYGDIVDILEVVDEKHIMPAIAVLQILSKDGTASVSLIKDYLKRQLLLVNKEIESDQSLIASYRKESDGKKKDLLELSNSETSKIFQVTRCSSCGGQLDLPCVHFMCRHSYHQRCLAEGEFQCPDCAKTHGMIKEIRKNNAELANMHDLFVFEVEDSEDGFLTIASGFGKEFMSFADPHQGL